MFFQYNSALVPPYSVLVVCYGLFTHPDDRVVV